MNSVINSKKARLKQQYAEKKFLIIESSSVFTQKKVKKPHTTTNHKDGLNAPGKNLPLPCFAEILEKFLVRVMFRNELQMKRNS